MSKPVRPKGRPRVFMTMRVANLEYRYEAAPVSVGGNWYWMVVDQLIASGKPLATDGSAPDGYRIDRDRLSDDYDRACRESVSFQCQVSENNPDSKHIISILDPAFSDTEAGI